MQAGHDQTGAAMGQFGRLTKVGQLPPPRVLTRYVREAMRMNEAGKGPPAKKPARRARPSPRNPAGLRAGLVGNARARVARDRSSPGHRRE